MRDASITDTSTVNSDKKKTSLIISWQAAASTRLHIRIAGYVWVTLRVLTAWESPALYFKTSLSLFLIKLEIFIIWEMSFLSVKQSSICHKIKWS